MFDFDSLREIGSTIKKNKLRTFLTGFSISWGIFMLIVLLSAGNGLKNGITSNMSRRAKNTISVWQGYTSIPYKGLAIDREIKFDERDYDLVRNKLSEVEYASAAISQTGNISYNKNYGSWTMNGVHPDAKYINNIEISPRKGRFINELDLERRLKVIVINTEMEDILFKDENPLGKYILAQNIPYQVIGVYKDETGRSNVPAFIPFSTAKSLYNNNYGFDRLDFTVKGLNTMEKNTAFLKKYKARMGALHNFDPEDTSALWISNSAEDSIQAESIFGGITLFLIVVGIASLMAGVVGVGNIMLITVKERTREFGIRKAIGATPFSVLKLVLLEATMITTVFGYIGMLLGIALTEFLNYILEMIAAQDSESSLAKIMKDPTVDLNIALFATLILIVAGVIAGYIPARKAVSISPIEAMRAE